MENSEAAIMHRPDNVSKIATIVGLVLEGLSLVMSFLGVLFISWLRRADMEFFYNLDPDFPEEFFEFLSPVLSIAFIVSVVMTVLLTIIFVVNVILFSKLLRNRFQTSHSKRVYIYQIIWGAINLLMNQLVGLAYLISGINGQSSLSRTTDKE